MTSSIDFPIVHPFQRTLQGSSDGFVTKLTANGDAIVYATYLGGRNSDAAFGIAVDATAAVYVAGSTSSADFPIVHPLQTTFGGGGSDAFVTKLTQDGSAIVFGTYLGGSSFDGANGLAVDATGVMYVIGDTLSANFPTFHAFRHTLQGSEDAFVAKLKN